MIIHQPEILHQGESVVAWAKIELEKRQANFPDYLWYRIPQQYSSYLSLQSDAFLVAALLAAMYYSEAIQVRGTTSPRLAYHLEEYQYILSIREPEILKRMKIDYHQIKPQEARSQAVGAPFSGGVDSLFTLFQHLPQNQPDPAYQITDAIFILGFDLLHTEREIYQQHYQYYQQQLAKYGINLIALETNMVSLTHQRLNLPYFYGPLLASTGLVLQAGLQRFYIPSSWDYYKLRRRSHTSDPLLDGFLSTEALDLIHHGSTYRRTEKTANIADWDLAQNVLWVCENTRLGKTSWNCSRCEKCARTMIPLYALGKLDRFTTFERPFRKNRDGLWWARKFSLRQNFYSELFPFVKQHKPDFIPWLYLAAFLGHIRYGMIQLVPGFLKHWLRRYGYFVTRNEAADAYENPEVIRLLRAEDNPPSA